MSKTRVVHIVAGKFEPAHEFNMGRLYGSEKYDIQNMILCQVKMPSFVYKGERVWEVWSDRIPGDSLNKALKLIQTTGSGDHYLAYATPNSLLEFAQVLSDEINGTDSFKVTGMLAVRYTNLDGYPSLRFSIVGELFTKRPVYSGMRGPNIIGNDEVIRADKMGRLVRHKQAANYGWEQYD
jgi:hypothetical protein